MSYTIFIEVGIPTGRLGRQFWLKSFFIYAISGLLTVISFDIGHCAQAQSLFPLKAISTTGNKNSILPQNDKAAWNILCTIFVLGQ